MLQVQLQKTWPLFLNRRILSMFTVNFLKNFMRLCSLKDFFKNFDKNNDVTLPQKYGYFTGSKYYGIVTYLVLWSATAKTSVYWWILSNLLDPLFLISESSTTL